MKITIDCPACLLKCVVNDATKKYAVVLVRTFNRMHRDSDCELGKQDGKSK